MTIIERGPDGYHHPCSEEQLQALVAYAYEKGLPLRVRGAGHSVAQAIYTSGYTGTGVPPREAIDVMLNLYRAFQITPDPTDSNHAVVEVEAGCNLGKNPYDPTRTSTWRNSLNYHLQEQGWALDDLGGISHQTVSGFLSTGSSGGSLTYSIDDNLIRLRIIDGTGTIWDLSRDDPDPDKREMFFAAGVSMGLLGVISKVWFRVRKTFNLYGSQVTTSTDEAGIDLFGSGNDVKPSLLQFLQNTPYTRLMWWPQHGLSRIQVWQAARMEPTAGFVCQPYQELGRAPQIAALAGSLFYTIIGNLQNISEVPGKLTDWYAHLESTIEGDPDVNACKMPSADAAQRAKYTVDDVLGYLRGALEKSFAERGLFERLGATEQALAQSLITAAGRTMDGPLHGILADIITWIVEMIIKGTFSGIVAQLVADVFEKLLPYLIPYILAPFVADGTQYFWDSWMCGLPMDNQMDDQLWPTEFTELWIPASETQAVMQELKRFYDGGGDPKVAYEHTGAFSCELYAATNSPFWMSPSYGCDVFRVDVFWFALNAGKPTDEFYPQFWSLLKKFNFRPHWGKYLPPPTQEWQEYYRANFPRMKDFLTLRDKLDPKQIFVTDYWRGHLGIEKPER